MRLERAGVVVASDVLEGQAVWLGVLSHHHKRFRHEVSLRGSSCGSDLGLRGTGRTAPLQHTLRVLHFGAVRF